MEIISYLNSGILEETGYDALPLDDLLQTQNKINRKKTEKNYGLMAETIMMTLADSFWQVRWVLCGLLAAAILVVVSFCGYQAIQSAPHTLTFVDQVAEESILMAGAMQDFVSSHDSDDFDENGNLFENDGTVPFVQSVSYEKYTVKAGENISSISKKFGLSNISTLISVNAIQNVRTLRAGQVLTIPNTDGIIHTVAGGESLAGISSKYQISVEDILDVNDLETAVIVKGQRLFIPGVHLDNSTLKKALGELFMNPLSAAYRISSCFGSRADPFTGVRSNHTGIDLACPTGTPIKCTKSGRVAAVGWTNVYGNYVIVSHDNGYQTLYAHMSRTSVKTGQMVDQGTQLGLVGSTGYSTGPHLHFSVYKNGKLVDPQTVIKF